MSDDDTGDSGVFTTLGPRGRIVRNSIAVLLLAFLVLTFALPYRLGALVSVAVALFYAVAQFLGTRSCAICGVPVSDRPWRSRAVSCPECEQTRVM